MTNEPSGLPSADESPSPQHVAVLAAVFEAAILLAALVLGRWLNNPPVRLIEWTLPGFAWGVAASLPLLAFFWLCIRFPWGPLGNLMEVVDQHLVPLFRSCRVIDLAMISIIAGLGEEMLFRGVIQESIAARMGGTPGLWTGLLVASVMFGLVHLVTPSYAVMAGLMGLYLGWTWLATRNLLVPITAHAAYDALALIYLCKIRRPHTAEDGAGSAG